MLLDVEFLAGCAALDLLFKDGGFVDFCVKELVLGVFKAQAGDSVGKTLSGDSLVPEEQNGPLDDVQHLFLTGKQMIQRLAVGKLLA